MPPLVASGVHQPSNLLGLPGTQRTTGLCERRCCSLGRRLLFIYQFLTYLIIKYENIRFWVVLGVFCRLLVRTLFHIILAVRFYKQGSVWGCYWLRWRSARVWFLVVLLLLFRRFFHSVASFRSCRTGLVTCAVGVEGPVSKWKTGASKRTNWCCVSICVWSLSRRTLTSLSRLSIFML